MEVKIERITSDKPEQVLIQCYIVTNEVESIAHFARTSGSTLPGYLGERIKQIPIQEIFYVEAVDNRVFAYSKNQTYELKCKLYEFERNYHAQHFFRCSKSMLVNLMKIDSVSPVLNGRFSAKLFNGEQVIISRQYVPELKEILLGGNI